MMTGARMRALFDRQNWEAPVRDLAAELEKKSPAAVAHGGAMVGHRSRGSHRIMWVAPSSAGCSSLTRRQ